MGVSDSEDRASRDHVLCSLTARQLSAVQVLVSDVPAGFPQAIAALFGGANWQRCRVHFMRHVLAAVPNGNAKMFAAETRPNFARPACAHVLERFEVIIGMLGRQLPTVGMMMREANDDLLALTPFPQAD